PAEAKPNRENVPHDREHGGHHGIPIDNRRRQMPALADMPSRVEAGDVKSAAERDRQRNCCKPLDCIQYQRCDAQRRRSPADVGRADIAASALADVRSAKNPDEQVAKRNRAKQVSGCGNDQRRSHSWFLWFPTTQPARLYVSIFVYFDPPGPSLLSYK